MRILAVTADASLLTALTSMMLDWEIKGVRDATAAKESAEGAQMALVDSGSTARGVETAKALWEAGVTLPALVIGDTPAPAGARVRVIVRPFSLQDLTSAVDEVSSAVPLDPRTGTDTPPAPEPAHEPRGAHEPPPRAHERAPDVATPGTTAGEPWQPEAPAPPGPRPIPEQPVASGPVAEVPDSDSEPALAEPVPLPQPAWQPGAAREEPATIATVTELPQPVAPRQEAGALRRLLRRKETPERALSRSTRSEDPMVLRLRIAIDSARELETLVHELPVLAQPRAMAHAFLGEVVEMFAPQVAAVYATLPDGSYGVIAAHGLSNVEAGMRVPADQELFMEMARTLEAVLVAPVDLAQGLVAGIGGARTEALMAAPLAVGDVCHAIVVVGRQDFSEYDLDLLSEQADEAAPGLALAQMIDHIRGL